MSNLISQRFSKNGEPAVDLNYIQEEMKNQIENKLSAGEYAFNDVQECKNCKSNSFKLISERDRYGFEHPVRICKECGLIQQNPHYTQETYNKFYEIEYRRLYSGREGNAEEDFRNQYDRGKEIIEFLDQDLEGVKVLEIGTGVGGILKSFEEEGAIIKGIDLGSDYIQHGQKKGLNLEVGSLEDVSEFEPDLVVYSHVLEHILEPRRELRKLREKFSDFSVYIELPGVKNLRNSYEGDFLRQLQNAHITYFTKETLANLLSRENFEVEKMEDKIKCLAKPKEKVPTKDTPEFHQTLRYLKYYEILRHIPFSKHLLNSKIRATGKLLEKHNVKRYVSPAYRKIYKPYLE